VKQLSNNIILVSGDSWAAGELPVNQNDSIKNVGVCKQFLDYGYQVRNLAKPGGSNLESIDRINDYLNCNQHEISNIKFILFWQTEFFREIWYFPPDKVTENLKHGYLYLKDQWIYHPYHKLTQLSQKWKLPVYIIGGCSDTVWFDKFEKDFPGIKIICQSATNLILQQNHRITDPVFCEFIPGLIEKYDFLNLVKKNISHSDLEILLHDMQLGKQRLEQFHNNRNYFYPDGIHPNANAQTIIFEFLCDAIPEIKIKKV